MSFNIKWSNPELRKYLSKKYNISWKFLKAIIERIIDNSNIIVVIYGTPNSGKSEVAQMIAFYIRYIIWKYLNKRIEIFTAFSTSEFQTILPEMEIGDVGLRDESPDESGMGSKNVKKYLNNITRIVRQNQNSFVFVDPTLIKLKVASFYLETAGKNKVSRKVRCILYDKDHKPMGHIYLPLHWCGLFRKKYKINKTSNINSGMANAGMFTPDINSKRIDRDEKRLLEHCIKEGVSKKGEIKGQIDRYNRQFKRPEDKIKGDTNYMDILIANVWHDLNKFRFKRQEREIEKRREEQKKIKYYKGDSFPEFVRNNLIRDEYKKVGLSLAKGDTKNEIRGNYPDVKDLNTIIDMLKYKGNTNQRICFLFEKWFALKKGVPKNQLNEILGGTSNAPDLIWKGIIYSIKWTSNRLKKTVTYSQNSIKKDGLRPEYTYAKEHNKTYILVFMNPAWDLRVRTIPIDPHGDDEVTISKDDI